MKVKGQRQQSFLHTGVPKWWQVVTVGGRDHRENQCLLSSSCPLMPHHWTPVHSGSPQGLANQGAGGPGALPVSNQPHSGVMDGHTHTHTHSYCTEWLKLNSARGVTPSSITLEQSSSAKSWDCTDLQVHESYVYEHFILFYQINLRFLPLTIMFYNLPVFLPLFSLWLFNILLWFIFTVF